MPLDPGAVLPENGRVLKQFIVGLFALLALQLCAVEPEKSVIHIATFSQEPAWDAPWRSQPLQRFSGSGFVISGKRIMSNAHVVSGAKQLIVHRYQDPRSYRARVEFVGHDCDLVVLTVDDPSFFNGLEPLELGDLPKVRSTVVTMGYPAGGQQISFTRGVVSRVEVQPYSHPGNRALLAVQTDAAINPGNSGGPVIQDDKVVGVAFQGIPGLENAGFFIPPPVIEHFLKDVADGKYDGFPSLGIRLAPLQNPAYRKLLKLPDDDVGVRVDSMLPTPEATALWHVDDVLLKIDGHNVASDGTIVFEGNRVDARVAVQLLQLGESLPVKIWRDGREQTLQAQPFLYDKDKAEGNQHDVAPTYFVYGGLVFTPLSMDYLRATGVTQANPAATDLASELVYRWIEKPETARPEPVVLASILPHPVNANFKIRARVLVDKINGIRIDRLADVPRAFESGTNAQHIIEFRPDNQFECLDKVEAEKVNAAILKTYGVEKARLL